jgi:hypothetical protein
MDENPCVCDFWALRVVTFAFRVGAIAVLSGIMFGMLRAFAANHLCSGTRDRITVEVIN